MSVTCTKVLSWCADVKSEVFKPSEIFTMRIACRDEVRCREKWTNVLDPACADTAPFTVHEDAVIMHEARQHSASGGGGGAVRWASVASKLVGRTDAQCLRRWRELCGPVAAKVYAEKAKKRRAIAVPRHSRWVGGVLSVFASCCMHV